ncbi:transcriptional regulator, TetR family [Lentzea fradiae]|uniref:Transcriptional regulator, TetR family n=1 Tax=Lentzea fradiae TaxID=200378 RepID=A0A1G8AEY0_9PSEU|nr:TetR/AcrR family transcriptional regulator [Lentzea fradiae]SDH18880.1 transcriptional regulator, TetR family [Lentzea fradiae]
MEETRARTRQQVLEAAAGILERDGVQAVSTRSVAAAAGIRAASLYQFFEDKDGLLDALAVHAFDLYLAGKDTLPRTADPVADLRLGWDAHVAFGLAHPALYLLMFTPARPGRRPPAGDRARVRLLGFLDRVAEAGRLRVPPAVAAELMTAAAIGVTLRLVSAEDPDTGLSARMRDTVIGSVVTDVAPAEESGLAPRALALDAALAAADDLPLRSAETALLRDWLERLAQ